MSAARAHPADAAERFDAFACPLAGVQLVEASAGTGKTWNLSALALRLLLEHGIGIERLLVVTFTRPATAELRTRIRARLVAAQRATEGTGIADPFTAALLAAASRAGVDEATVRERVTRALARFDEAAIHTIHGFCQRALAEVPFAAGLPMRFDVVARDRATLERVCADFWRRELTRADLDAALAQHITRTGDSPARWADLLERRLARPLARLRWDEPHDDNAGWRQPAALAGADPDPIVALRAAQARARAAWSAEPTPPDLVLAALAELNGNTYRPHAVEQAGLAWQAWLASDDPLRVPAVTGVAAPEKRLPLLGATSLARRTKRGRRTPTHEFFDAAQALLDLHEAILHDAARRRQRLLRAMLAECADAACVAKRARRTLAYDDLLRELRESLADPRLAWLAATLRARWPAALVDEFQDTDAQQFAIFEAIYGGHDGPRGPMFLVGDPKQAIYAFRNADVHVYLAARAGADHRHALDANQRAVAPLVRATNRLFGANPRAFLLEGLACPPASVGDKARPVLVDADDTNPAALRVAWLSPGGELPARARALELAAAACAAEVARLLEAGRAGAITLDAAPLRAADIAVLVRTHGQAARMREALRAHGVGSVELARESIFATPDAADLERVLLAVLDPARPATLRAALATEAEGFDAQALAALDDDDEAAGAAFERYAAYRQIWLARGVAPMLAAWMNEVGVRERLLARGDGERRLTNLLHLAEVLQEAQAHHDAPHSLARWFAARRADDDTPEESQLRLESDENLVRIVTVHKAKGLEYPIAFCPFAWDGHRAGRRANEPVAYHENGELVIDLRDDAAEDESAKRRMREEADAESVRLLYVALTRAVHRCYLVAGCYVQGAHATDTASRRSLLNWLVAGGEQTDREAQPPEAAEIELAWRALARDGDGISLAPLALDGGARRHAPEPAAARLEALAPPARIDAGWRIGSFTGLMAGTANATRTYRIAGASGGEPPAADHDALPGLVDELRAPAPHDTASDDDDDTPGADDFLHFPRGPAAGDCVHALLEAAPLEDPARWGDAIDAALVAHPPAPGREPRAPTPAPHAAMLQRLLANLACATLPGGIGLATIDARARLVEMGFHFPVSGVEPSALSAWLDAHGYPVPPLAFTAFDGYLSGFVDLVFRHEGRYHVLDWKSNHLGMRAADYAAPRLASAVAEHGYALQAVVYALAVHRMLARRLPGYDPGRHFGGVHYAFVRGMRPEWRARDATTPGVWTIRPGPAELASLDRLLGGRAA